MRRRANQATWQGSASVAKQATTLREQGEGGRKGGGRQGREGRTRGYKRVSTLGEAPLAYPAHYAYICSCHNGPGWSEHVGRAPS